ncbi:hypothetical protein BYT27DRAFT_7103327 [Phlegmacium glaucopus]|nr:hypothetical protein BYT27DRAFT_7103327 [Phlegmacium glaucopus]
MDSIKKEVFHQQSVHHLMCKGVFTEETHNVVHLLVKAGCSHKYMNKIISAVLKWITTVGTISCPSISQILCEGFFAAQIQLGYEMKGAESMTFSADGMEFLQSVIPSIHANSITLQWSADRTEHTHIDVIKDPADLSNNQSYESKIC